MNVLSILTPFIGTLISGIGQALGIDTDSDALKQIKLETQEKTIDVANQIALLQAQQDAVIAEEATKQVTAQLQVNANEASSPNMFVAGWRPAVGWICALGFAYAVFLCPLLTFIATVAGKKFAGPTFDSSVLTTVLFGMLGMSGIRSFDKWANTTPSFPMNTPIAPEFNIAEAAAQAVSSIRGATPAATAQTPDPLLAPAAKGEDIQNQLYEKYHKTN